MASKKRQITCTVHGCPQLAVQIDDFLDKVEKELTEKYNIELLMKDFDNTTARLELNTPIILVWLFEVGKEADIQKCMTMLRSKFRMNLNTIL